jgi:Bacterial PH domain
MGKTFRSNIDWRYGIENAFWLVLVAGMVVSFLLNPPPHGWPVAFVVSIVSVPVLIVAFAVWQTFTTSYTITATELLVKSAFFRWRISLHKIAKVSRTHNRFTFQAFSGPALSVERLQVTYDNAAGRRASVMILPKSNRQFLDDLAKAAGLEKDGDRLVRRG